MPWVRLDDEFAQHPKVVSLPYRGRWLHIAALCYSNRMLTDGFIPRAMVASLCPHEPQDPINEFPSRLAEQLVDVGLWEDAEGGYVIHDYAQYQPSKREVLAERKRRRAVRAAAGIEGAKKRWQTHSKADGKADGKRVANRIANVQQLAWQTDSPVPVPEDQISKGSVPHAPPLPRERARAPETTALAPLLPKNTRWTGRPAVPDFVHAELLQRLGPDETEADLIAFYAQTAAAWAERSIGDDNPRFWRARFAEWKGSTVGPRTKGQTVTAQNEAVLARALARRREGS